MGKLIKYTLYIVGGLVALVLVAAVIFSITFDPNDYREDIATQVRDKTGREFVIEGDLDVTLFPWLAVNIGKSQLGNAPGFGDEAFASFDAASLSVRIMPLILRQEILIGAIELDSLIVNLEVNARGVSNWQDLADAAAGEAPVEAADASEAAPAGTLDIAGIEISDANLSYANAQLDESYKLAELNVSTGAVSSGDPIDITASFGFSAQPAGAEGTVEMQATVGFDSDAATIVMESFHIGGDVSGLGDVPANFSLDAPAIELRTEDRVADLGVIELAIVDVHVSADIEAFSYADSPTPNASISIDAFSPRALMQTLDIEAPGTADPAALGNLMLDAKLAVDENRITLHDLVMVLDDTTLQGQLGVPRDSNGTFTLDLAADSIELDRYMAPASAADASGGGASDAPVEIPAELIRSINARGNLTLESATMGAMLFENLKVSINSANDQLRVHPISADFFDGNYQGDIRIDARGEVPVLAVDEKINDVSLAALGRAMLETNNLTGTIDGAFQLSGRGNDMGAVQRSLGGNMNFTLKEGTWEGTDIWYELRRARALFRQETPPEPDLPARTPFSEVRATSTVTNGIVRDDDFYAELPFMQLHGNGTVNLPEATVDYSLSGRVFEQPESVRDATAEELADLTQATIPLRITGDLASPSIGIDFEALLRERVQEELEDKLNDKLEDLFRR